ncbi:MAG: transposase [Burkholderiaceae bacterium]|nr:transposase [Burkholderiaceae bacterium]
MKPRWPRGFACPSCGGRAHRVFDRAGMRYWQCAGCPHQKTSLINGTIFEGTKLALRVWT